ncbi:MAG: hypothetical protein ABIJ09_25845 [Pseudomonadota bacterium]
MKWMQFILPLAIAVSIAACCDSEAACSAVEPGMSQSEALEPFCPGTKYDVGVGRFVITGPDGSTCTCPTNISDSHINGACTFKAAE